ncbi:MAG TPA: magnesium transporter CorA family protein [Elusimicrobiota bacterium]|nr:magnesium transporter CorA family protein [Elusimicrobiota bacterium]
MINAIYFNKQAVKTDLKEIDLPRILNDKEGFLWMDVNNIDDDDEAMALLTKEFKFHQLSLEDCIFPQHHSKFEMFENYIFVASHGIKTYTKNTYLNMEFEDVVFELDVFIGKNYVVTVHTEDVPQLRTVFEKAKLKPQMYCNSFEHLLYDIFGIITGSFNPLLSEIESRVDHIQDMMVEGIENLDVKGIFYVKRTLLELRRIIEPEIYVFSSLTREAQNLLTPRSSAYFRDIFFYMNRLDRMTELYSQIMTSSLEVYYSSISTKLNKSIKYLTIMATIFMPPAIITSYYGMNVSFPEQQLGAWALPLVWVFMVVVAGGIIWYLKRSKVL